MTTLDARLAASNAAFAAARAAARAAHVPKSDLAPCTELVTVSGWYEQPTISGRPAWRRCTWVNGRLRSSAATYDRERDLELDAIAEENYLVQRDVQRASAWEGR